MLRVLVALVAAVSFCTAANIHVGSHSGLITSFNFAKHDDGTYSLDAVGETNFSAPSPGWLTLDDRSHILYSIDQGLNAPNGSLNSFRTSPDGSLTPVSRLPAIIDGLSSTIITLGSQKKALAVAHYDGSAISTWSIYDDGTFEPLQTITFSLDSPGPVEGRQTIAHPHQIVPDPTGKFFLVPDLGADLIRIFKIDNNGESDQLVECEPLKVQAGSGPRHALFWTPVEQFTQFRQRNIFLYVDLELTNQIIGYKVTYPEEGKIAFEQLYESSVFGSEAGPAGAFLSEIAILVSPYTHPTLPLPLLVANMPQPNPPTLLLSIRNDKTFNTSDSLSTFSLTPKGELIFLELYPAGGSFPRTISINKAGNLVAVGVEKPAGVVVLEGGIADAKNGLGGVWKWNGVVAQARIEDADPVEAGMGGEVTGLVWDE